MRLLPLALAVPALALAAPALALPAPVSAFPPPVPALPAPVPAVAPAAGTPELSGRLSSELVLFGPRGTPLAPDAGTSLGDYRAATAARVAVEGGERSRARFVATCVSDAVTGRLEAELLRASVEARLTDAVSLAVGRQLIGFGCGLVWNPVNGLDPRRDPFDRAAERKGVDAAKLVLDLGASLGAPISVSVEGISPSAGAGAGISESVVAAQVYAYAGGAELSLVGDFAAPSGGRKRWSAGAWGTYDLRGLVVGLEGAYRRTDDAYEPGPDGGFVTRAEPFASAALTLSSRIGDWFLFAEGYYSGSGLDRGQAAAIGRREATEPAGLAAFAAWPGSIGRYHAAAGIEWSSDPYSAGLTILLDVEEAAGAGMASFSWALDDRVALKLEASLPLRSARVSEYDFSPARWSAGIGLEAFF